ncbi:MAG: hypothetical protein KDK30_08980 [Leptospiraceae bacterium]|nr:hypothetical protein [Leptospiraceae bacterium]
MSPAGRESLRHSLIVLLAFPIALVPGCLLFSADAIPVHARLGAHLLALLCSYPFFVLREMDARERPFRAVTVALSGIVVRVGGLLGLLVVLLLIDASYIRPALWLYLITTGSFLCFQVVSLTCREDHDR